MKYSYFRLDELGIVSRGRSKHRPRNDSSLYGGKYPFIQTADVKNAGLYITEWSQTYNERGLAQSKLWHPGTLCITIAANIADTAILCMPACFPDSIMGFIPYEDKCDVKYMKYCFDILQMKCQQIAEGTAQDNLSWEKLSTIQFPVPDITTQKRIASILSAYDDLIENNRRQIKLLEEAAQRLYREWFVELRFPGHEDVKIVDGVPEGWKKVKLQEICPVKTGKKDANFGTTDGKYPFFTCAQAPIQAPSYSFDCSAVILAGNGDFNVKIYRGQFEAYQRTYVLSPLDLEHLFLLFNSVRMNMDVLTKGASGSTIKFLTKGMIDSIELLIPPALLLDQYNKISESIQSKVELLKHKIDLSTEVRDMLLPKLMSGEMEVSS